MHTSLQSTGTGRGPWPELLGGDQDSSVLPLGVGWEAFADADFIVQMAIVFWLSVGLAALIGYHPSTRATATNLEDIERPKTFIMYSMVASVIALIVKVQPSMALVVFGIGGLLRFRTDVGKARDTGRVILVTVIGLCCGLELFVVAVLATAFGWVLIFALERSRFERLVVHGLDRDSMNGASDVYTRLLRHAGCAVVGEQRHLSRGTVSITYLAPRDFSHRDLEPRVSEIPAEVRGALEWGGS